MSALPQGTVTFMFTDVEGSTRLLHELRDDYAGVLAEHRRRLRKAFERYGGVEVDTQGDAFFVAFARASDALAAATEARDALASGPIRVRIGLHTGEPVATSEGYVGIDVHRAARIAAAGHGGQVLVSQATRELTGVDGLRDLGEHRLKDLMAPERIYQLGDRDFPPLKTLYRTNLPIVATPFVGRERELKEAVVVLSSSRLLTLTGPGGSGKTRLALHVAAAAVETFPDGVFWVPLQAVRDPAIVERTIAAAIGADDSLIPFLGAKRLLLLLDNFEQVVEAAPTVAAIVSGTPNTTVLVTSREPLHVTGELCYPVEPLERDEAVQLFEERARAVSPRFRTTGEVAQIVERLDRLPLAIELAAARVVLLDMADLLERLEQRLPLLASRSRDAPARQQTLRATIEWSYELLDEEEQRLFRRLSVFRGVFALDAAGEICAGTIDAVESLLVKNLLRRRFEGSRVLMLDTIREYASERLEASDEANEIHRRHATYFLGVADRSNLNAGNLRPGGQQLELAFADQDNFRGALAWAVRSGEAELALRLATALEQFWVANDPLEGVRWFDRIFACGEVSSEARAHGLRAWASATHIGGGDPADSQRLCEQSLALFEELDDEHGQAVLLHRLSIMAMLHGEPERARGLVETSHHLHARSDNAAQKAWGHAQTTATLGALARDRGDDATAAEFFSESAGLAEEVGVDWWRGGVLAELSALALRQDDLPAAERLARESLELADRLGDRSGRIFGVGLLAATAAERGELERAGRLWGAIEDQKAFAPLGGWVRHRGDCEARVQRHAGEALDAGLVVGWKSELEDAVYLALSLD